MSQASNESSNVVSVFHVEFHKNVTTDEMNEMILAV